MHKKSVFYALIGHTLERYDLALYGYFATLLAPLFFPSGNKRLQILGSLGAFAAGYIMRPVGGILFGYFGDRYGRKIAFLYSIFVIIIPVLIMAFLPTYESIGIFAPIILIFCRLLQGLCGGGEFAGAGIYIGEHLHVNHKGFGASLVCATGILGAAIGTCIGAVCTLPNMPSWGWRVAFLCGAVFTIASYLLRKRMAESPEFKKFIARNTPSKRPFLDALIHNKVNVLNGIFIGGCGHIFLYLSGICMNVIYASYLRLPSYKIMAINTCILLFWVFLSPLSGIVADKIGVRRLMSYAALSGLFFAFPLFSILHWHLSISTAIFFQVCLSFIGIGFVAPLSALFTSLFPVDQRYSAVGFSITLGQAILGGTSPLISAFLIEFTGDMRTPGLLLVLGCVLGLYGLITFKDLSQKHSFPSLVTQGI
jgi:MHS family proline/betaine transporter-like MFS transporter